MSKSGYLLSSAARQPDPDGSHADTPRTTVARAPVSRFLRITTAAGAGRRALPAAGAAPRTGQAEPNPRLSPDRPARASILLIDDDDESRERIATAFTRSGMDVVTAVSGAEALAVASERRFDLIVSEMYLVDMTGINVVNRLRRGGGDLSFIFVSAFLTITATVEAMQAGALTVVEKPLDTDTFFTTVLAALALSGHAPAPAAAAASPARVERPRSVADRWARYVWQACGSLGDLKTLAEWARFVGLSYSGLCETCRLLDIRPHDARDFTRVLRAVVQSHRQDCRPEVLLDVSDRRTLRNILDRTGIGRSTGSVSVEDFLSRQTFIPANNEGLLALRALIDRPETTQTDVP